ncbi:MAG: LamG-like jellyroll fold domain-containing protein, partial [Planctomycetota bacterium]
GGGFFFLLSRIATSHTTRRIRLLGPPRDRGGRSYEAVFRVDDLSGPRVIAAGGKGIALPRFQLIILNSGAIRGMASLSSTLYNQQSSSGTITVGTWCHFVMVVPDPIADVELYLDGELLTTSTSAIGLNPDNGMSIGARDQGGLINPFDGPISLFNIWDAPLTASEVAAQYQALKAGDRRSVDRSIGRSVSRFAS